MTETSNALGVDGIVLPMGADEPDIDDALGISRLTSAGFAQSACLTCRNQAIAGSRASATPSLWLRKALIVLSAITLTLQGYHSPVLGPRTLSTPFQRKANLFTIDLNFTSVGLVALLSPC